MGADSELAWGLSRGLSRGRGSAPFPFPDLRRYLMASGGPASPAIDRPAQAGPLGLTSCCLCEAPPHHLTGTGQLPGGQTFGKGGARLPQRAGSRPRAGCLHGWSLSSALSLGPPHPAPGPSQPLPAAGNATDTGRSHVAGLWHNLRPPSTQKAAWGRTGV